MTYRSLESRIRETQAESLYVKMEEAALNEAILNSNSSGQGHDPDHANHEYHDTMGKHGYYYSHTTPIRQRDGSYKHHHTYKHNRNSDYNAAVYNGGWQTGVGGLARKTKGVGAASLDQHLKNRKVKSAANGDPTKTHHTAPVHGFKEEVEPIDELKKSTLGSYIKKASSILPSKEMELDNVYNHDLQKTIKYKPDHESRAKVMKDIDKRERDIAGHHKGIERAVARLTKEEVEPVDEISKEKLGRYVKGALQDIDQSSSELTRRHIRYNSFGDKDAAKGALAVAAKHLKRKAGIGRAVDKLVYEPMRKEEVEPVEELLKPMNPIQQKLAQEKQQVQKQKGAIQLQIAKEKAAKQEQAMKQKGQEQLSKIKEDDVLDERAAMVPLSTTFGRANRFSRIHAQQYQRLASHGQFGRAELHRKRMIEWKRRAYMAHDNPEKLQR